MIDLSSTAHEFALLNGLAGTVNALPGLFGHLNVLADMVDARGFVSIHEASIDILGKASSVWLEVASILTLMTQTQAQICSRLKNTQADWQAESTLAGSEASQRSARQLDLHDQLISHGLLVKAFVSGFVRLIEELDGWVAKAVPALSLLSNDMQRWHDAMITCSPATLERLPWKDLLLRMHQIAIKLDATAGEWLAYKGGSQALAAVRRAGHMLLIAPVTAAQHATNDLGMLAKVLTDSVDQLEKMQPEQASSVYHRHLTFAVLSCDNAQRHCEHLLALTAKADAR